MRVGPAGPFSKIFGSWRVPSIYLGAHSLETVGNNSIDVVDRAENSLAHVARTSIPELCGFVDTGAGARWDLKVRSVLKLEE